MHKKIYFGGRYEIRYDVVWDHDTFAFLRVSLEAPRHDLAHCLVLLNGTYIGIIRIVSTDRPTRPHFQAYRLDPTGPLTISVNRVGTFQCTQVDSPPVADLGLAVAKIISVYV